MKKAINAWSVDGKTGFQEMFAQLKTAGFEKVELNIDKPESSAHNLSLETTAENLTEIRHMAEEEGLAIGSISTSLWGSRLGSAEQDDLDFAKTLLEKQIYCAQRLGASGVLAVPGGNFNGGQTLLSAHENALEALASMQSLIESSDILVGLENVWNGFFLSPFDMANFLDRLNIKNLGAYFDVGNVVAASNPESWIEVLGKRIVKVHVKDFARKGGFYSGGDFVDLWAGNVQWETVMRGLSKAGYADDLTAEVFPTRKYDDMTVFYREVSEQMDRILALNA